MLRNILNTIAIIIGLFIIVSLSYTVRMPGFSESTSCLESHGTIYIDKITNNFYYTPAVQGMSVEELEALSVLKPVYNKLQIMPTYE